MNRFASTFKENIYKKPLSFAKKVDGSGTINEHIYATGRWLNVSIFDKDIYHIISDAFMGKIFDKTLNESSGEIFLAVANLRAFQHLLVPIAVNRSPGPSSEFAGVAAGDFDDDGIDEFVAVRN